MPRDLLLEASGDQTETRRLVLRKPRPDDGPAIWELVRACKPLDENSLYCNLVQAEHFADTCVVAERDGAVVGWISGHMIPGEPTHCSSGKSRSVPRRGASASGGGCCNTCCGGRNAPEPPA